jgi:hypothetical protein
MKVLTSFQAREITVVSGPHANTRRRILQHLELLVQTPRKPRIGHDGYETTMESTVYETPGDEEEEGKQ